MLNSKLNYIVCFFILILTCTSCVKDVDFNQAENLTLTPIVAASVVYTDVEASRFSENGTEIETVRDSIANIEIFTEQFVIDNLVRTDLVFEVTNSIDRSFELDVEFLDESDTLLDVFTFEALPSNGSNEVITMVTEVYENERLEALKQTTKLVITLRLLPSSDGSTLNENSTGRIILKSKGLFYLNLSA
ncbi:hypothetical protein [Winogradskyella tangerina]|uniref:hypothetical protein n=1 Tax=Winogradskyella tangerina TaxID=2023240 RepID=UPI000DBE8FC4|nr:hypothetical protein [Winogradskyella tangerina]